MSKEEVRLPTKEEILGAPDEDLGTGEDEGHYVPTNDVEQQALDMGWNPDKDSVGDKWVSAEIFLARAPLFDELHSVKRALKNRNKELDAIKSHLDLMRKKELKATKDSIEARRKDAFESMDYDAMSKIDEELDAIKEEEKKVAAEDTKNEVPEEYVEWKSENSWYTTDKEMTEYADLIGPGIFSRAKEGQDVTELYEEITKHVKKMFPEKFKKPSDKPAATVDSSRASTRSTTRQVKSKHSLRDLPEEHRQIAMTLIRAGHVSEEDYLKDYFS